MPPVDPGLGGSVSRCGGWPGMSDPVARMIADHLLEEAQWRLSGTDKHVSDHDARRAAAALIAAASFVERLPAGDQRVRQIDAACRVIDVGEFVPGERARYGLIRQWCLGSRGPCGSPEAFLRRLVDCCVEDAVAFSKEFGDRYGARQKFADRFGDEETE
jgi:hypothetical protein